MVPSDPQADAMDAIFSLERAITAGNLSIQDLSEVVAFAVEEGHERLIICLQMAASAVAVAGDKNS